MVAIKSATINDWLQLVTNETGAVIQ